MHLPDLKAENIFILQLASEKPVYVIGDLDSAKMTLSEKAQTTIGTPCFMAPEVLGSGHKESYTAKADGRTHFSLGLSL